MEFKVGDVVQLKSGGPRMAVDRVEADGIVHCSWFDKAERKTDAFNSATLKVVPDRSGGVTVARRPGWAEARRG